MASQAREIVEQIFGRWRGQELTSYLQGLSPEEIERMMDDFDPEIEVRWHQSFPDQREFHGHEALLAGFAHFFEQFEEYRIEAVRMEESGDVVVVDVIERGLGKGSGVETEMNLGAIWEVRDGRVARITEYDSFGEALAAV